MRQYDYRPEQVDQFRGSPEATQTNGYLPHNGPVLMRLPRADAGLQRPVEAKKKGLWIPARIFLKNLPLQQSLYLLNPDFIK